MLGGATISGRCLECAALVAIVALMLGIAQPASATQYVVTTVADNGDDVSPISGSLREAILLANADAGSTIAFRIGSGPKTIVIPDSANHPLPIIQAPVTLDATTQPGYDGQPIIELTAAVAEGAGLRIGNGGTTVKGIAINRFYFGMILAGNGNNGGNTIVGNHIGTDMTGRLAVPNQIGIWLITPAGDNVISDNLVSGNRIYNVLIQDSDNNLITENLIGPDASGTSALSHGSIVGVSVFNSLDNRVLNNVVSGNRTGVYLARDDNRPRTRGGIVTDNYNNTIEGNYIGTTSTMTSLGNLATGVIIDSPGASVIGNVIAYNEDVGVAIVRGGLPGVPAVPTRASVLGNSIYANSRLGIDLNHDGETVNDPCDHDTGPNQRQNFPLVWPAISDNEVTTITGTLNSTPDTAFRVELFADKAPAVDGLLQGETYLGFVMVTTGSDCTGSFSFSLDGSLPAGGVVSATATDPSGNTSEFSVMDSLTVMWGVQRELQAVGTTVSGTRDLKRLNAVINHLAKAMDRSFWADPDHLQRAGARAFNESKHAIDGLAALIADEGSSIPPGVVQESLDRLLGATRALALGAIVDAEARGGNPANLEKANLDFARGDYAAAVGRPQKAAGYYRSAWSEAGKA